MARFAIIQGGQVANIAEASSEFAESQGWIPAADTVAKGDLWDGSVFSKPPAPPPVVPASVTRRKGMAVLIKHGIDVQVDAALNSQLTAATNSGDAAAILAAKLAINDWKQSLEFQRAWPLIGQMKQVFGWTDAFVDGLFIEADAL